VDFDYVRQRGALTMQYQMSDGTVEYDVYLPAVSDGTVDGMNGTPVPNPEEIIFYHEIAGHPRLDWPGTIAFENAVRQDLGMPPLPLRSGLDHDANAVIRGAPELLTTTSPDPNSVQITLRPLKKPD
jgi:hypothetical protein